MGGKETNRSQTSDEPSAIIFNDHPAETLISFGRPACGNTRAQGEACPPASLNLARQRRQILRFAGDQAQVVRSIFPGKLVEQMPEAPGKLGVDIPQRG